MAILIDSYSETNQNDEFILSSSESNYSEIGQSFANTVEGTLDSCKFYLRKGESPTGNAVAKVYAHTGTYGSGGTPTGAVLATSDNFDVSGLSTSFELITFNFSGAERITLSANTKYFVICCYNTSAPPNTVKIGFDTSSLTHGGNGAFYYSSWSSSPFDGIFYVYRDIIASTSPSVSPSLSPSSSLSPSESPSMSPSLSPSISVSISPSLSLSFSPSLSSSISPSVSPSASKSPSLSTSISPSLSPSLSPSVSPSSSISPSVSPPFSFSPSVSPSSSLSPSTSPSLSPSASFSPSVSSSLSPSISPSESPSLSPSFSSSESPSLSSSISPSLSSSFSASKSPSFSPSLSPSVSPSVSLSPSVSPSFSPSISPSVSPSISQTTKFDRQLIWKIYNESGTFLETLTDVISDLSIEKQINGGDGDFTFQLSRKIDNFDEGGSISFNNRVKVYLKDAYNTSGTTLVANGYIVSYRPYLRGKEEGLEVTCLSAVSKLSNDFYRTGTAAAASDLGVELSTQRVDDMMKAIINHYRSVETNTMITNDFTNVDQTTDNAGVLFSFDHRFFNMKHLDALREVSKFLPRNKDDGYWFYWRINTKGDLVLKNLATTAYHTFIVGKHIQEISGEKTIEGMINRVYFWNEKGTVDPDYLKITADDATSQTNYDIIADYITDSKITNPNAASLLADSRVYDKKDPKVKIKVVLNGTYDLALIEPGQTCQILNLKNNPYMSGTDGVLVINSMTYEVDSVTLELSEAADNFEDIVENERQRLDKEMTWFGYITQALTAAQLGPANRTWSTDIVFSATTGANAYRQVDWTAGIVYLPTSSGNSAGKRVILAGNTGLMTASTDYYIYLNESTFNTAAANSDSGTGIIKQGGEVLGDAAKAWSADQYKGYIVTIGGQTKVIKSNTATVLTIEDRWTIADTTAAYTIKKMSFDVTSDKEAISSLTNIVFSNVKANTATDSEAIVTVTSNQNANLNIDGSTQIAKQSITANEIRADYAYIGTIDADQINVGTLTGFTIQTATTGLRLVLSGADQFIYWKDDATSAISMGILNILNGYEFDIVHAVSPYPQLSLAVTGAGISFATIGDTNGAIGVDYNNLLASTSLGFSELSFVPSVSDSLDLGTNISPGYLWRSIWLQKNHATDQVIYANQIGEGQCADFRADSSSYSALYLSQSGSTLILHTNVAGCFLTKAGVWTDASSKLLKENFEDISVLDKLKTLEIKKYNYISEAPRNETELRKQLINSKKRKKYNKKNHESIKVGTVDEEHLKEKLTKKELAEIDQKVLEDLPKEQLREVPKHFTPMAEDINRIFGLGDDKGISPSDIAGIALQAIKELTLKVEELEAKVK